MQVRQPTRTAGPLREENGRVVRLFDRYGYAETPTGTLRVFVRPDVPPGTWERLAVGCRVRLETGEGVDGRRSTALRLLDGDAAAGTGSTLRGADARRENLLPFHLPAAPDAGAAPGSRRSP